MFIIRTAFWLGIAVMVLPTDQESQAHLAAIASNRVKQVATLCERNAAACQHGIALWDMAKAKAQVAGRMAFDLALDRAGNRAMSRAGDRGDQAGPPPGERIGMVPPTETPPPLPAARGPSHQLGTLRQDDVTAQWRGSARGRM